MITWIGGHKVEGDYARKVTRFPPGLENLENWESIFQSGNFTQNTGKVWKMIKLMN